LAEKAVEEFDQIRTQAVDQGLIVAN